jgi:hypothetical protein
MLWETLAWTGLFDVREWFFAEDEMPPIGMLSTHVTDLSSIRIHLNHSEFVVKVW